MSTKDTAKRSDYSYYQPVQTRWSDNDLYGHVNNVIYYSYFDTVVNNYLIEFGGFDIRADPVIGIAVETHCTFVKAVAYPDRLEAGLSVGRLGNSSVRYEVGIFLEGDDEASASGYFAHVFVERASSKPVLIPAPLRSALAKIQLVAPAGGGDG